MHKHYFQKLHQQSGVVMPIVLIFLVIMMLLGVTAIRNVTMEERMASSVRNRHLAFQAAEQALRVCETMVQQGNMGTFNVVPAGPLKTGPDNGRNYWESDNQWATVGNVVPASAAEAGLNLVAAQPRCIIEVMDRIPNPVNPADLREQFRITARGVGATTNASVILQSYIVLI